MNYKGKAHKVGEHIDTDAIIPARFLVTTDAKKLGENCMSGLEPDWAKRVSSGDIMVAGRNFGCGSSREHAPWALTDYGFKVVIAPSFADIFYGNSFNNQLLPVTLSDEQVDELFKLVQANPGITFEVDLEAQVVKAGDKTYSFKIDDFRRHCMLNGLDSIGLTLQHEAAISDYEHKLPAFMN
mgnify:CR=1 FL=1